MLGIQTHKPIGRKEKYRIEPEISMRKANNEGTKEYKQIRNLEILWRFSPIRREVLCLSSLFIQCNPIHLTERSFHCFPPFLGFDLHILQYKLTQNTIFMMSWRRQSWILPTTSKVLKMEVHRLSKQPLPIMNQILLQMQHAAPQTSVVRPSGPRFHRLGKDLKSLKAFPAVPVSEYINLSKGFLIIKK